MTTSWGRSFPVRAAERHRLVAEQAAFPVVLPVASPVVLPVASPVPLPAVVLLAIVAAVRPPAHRRVASEPYERFRRQPPKIYET